MSERILRALMQLFAIIAKVDDDENSLIQTQRSRKIVESFLKSELNTSLVTTYLHLYDEFLQTHHGRSQNQIAQKKRTAVNSVKVLRICSQINEELTQRQKVIVLFRIFEFIHSNDTITEKEIDFVTTVSDSFNIPSHEFELIRYIQKNDWTEEIDDKDVLYITPHIHTLKYAKNYVIEGIDSKLCVLRIKSINTLFFRYFGQDELILNGQIVSNERTYILNNGSSIKTLKSKTVYYSDIITRFLEDNQTDKVLYKVDNVEYLFKKGKTGLHKISLEEESGKLVGIMGGSGTGKSTLLNIFNGNLKPSSGSITINNIDIHKSKDLLEGVIGYVSQDDLLIEELTVFQNLFFNTKLAFDDLSDMAITKKVITVLNAVGLQEVKDLVVGSVLEKTISGGQRKRLNIALELIREPFVLFVDEPTSGLSSRDSENIMDLLKELALKGKLVFVVIHQPSSDIFKMFDRLLILDQGGFPIFDGNPLDSIVYFKTHIHHVNAEEKECQLCGNVNPEQIFNIIDAKVVDEYGNFTKSRKTSPQEWNELYRQYQHILAFEKEESSPVQLEEIHPIKHAVKMRQFSVFFIRDVLSKLGNTQYIVINALVAPILALILSLFVRYYKISNDISQYIFFENENIPQYLFIAVIVALFLGLTVAAEEINKDKKILKRETFLNLSRSSYLTAKISILFLISAIQTFSFVLIGHWVLEIQDMWFSHWLALFSISCLSNVTGLNISSAFNSAKVIYITVPLLIIPQLLLSGVIVKFDKLNPSLSNSSEVPLIGNLMASRWTYEAMVTDQVKNNAFEDYFFELNKEKYEAAWKKDYWVPTMKNQLNKLNNDKLNAKQIETIENLLSKEIKKEELRWTNFSCNKCFTGTIDSKTSNIENFLNILTAQYTVQYKNAVAKIDAISSRIGEKNYVSLQNQHVNENLYELVTNKQELDKIIDYQDQLIRKDNLIYINGKDYSFFQTPFYCAEKNIFGNTIETYWANLIIIWLMTALTSIALYFDWLKKGINFLNELVIRKIRN